MSNNLPAIPITDMTASEIAKVEKYKEEGLPELADVTNAELYRMLDLYLSGSTYTQIASILRMKKAIVLYLAHQNNWFESKQEYLNEIQEKIKARVVDAKLRNQEFTMLLVQAYQKRLSEKLHRYLQTGDGANMDTLNLKEVAQLMKAMEMINDSDGTGKSISGKPSPIGLNLGAGVIIEKTGEDQISITPKETTVGSLLQKMADEQRRKEKSLTNQSDIVKDTKGENNEK
jgi:hypothetical protein